MAARARKVGDWEVRRYPWVNPRTKVVSPSLFKVVCVNRKLSLVIHAERLTAAEAKAYDPVAAWAAQQALSA